MASDVFLQAFWLHQGRFLYDLTQLNICQSQPQEPRKLPGTLPAPIARHPSPPVYTLPPKV